MDSLISAPPCFLSSFDARRLIDVARRFHERPSAMKTVLRAGKLDLSSEESDALLRVGASDLIDELHGVLAGNRAFIELLPHTQAVLAAILETLAEEGGGLSEGLQRLRRSCEV